MSGTVWEPGRQMGTKEGATGAPDDLADVTHEPNQIYERQELSGDTAAQISEVAARVRRSLAEVRAGGDRAGVDQLITDVETLLALVDGTDGDRPESDETAPADLEE